MLFFAKIDATRDAFPAGSKSSFRREEHCIPAGERLAPLKYALGTTYNTPCYYLAGRVSDAANSDATCMYAC